MVNKKQVGMGASALAAAAAAAAAGYYFYASNDAPKHRKIAAKWASDLKKDAIVQAKKLERMDRTQVIAAIDAATAAYETARAIDPKALIQAARELKKNWRDLVQEAMPAAKRVAARVQPRKALKSAKKVAKKTLSKKARPRRTK